MKFLPFIFAVLLSLLPMRADAVIAVAQSISASVQGATDLTTGDLTTAASGSLFICDAVAIASGANSVLITDSKLNTYTIAEYVGSAFDDAFQGGQWYKVNGTGGATHNWTITYDVPVHIAIACKEVTGALTSGALDQSSTKGDNTGDTGLTSGVSLTTTQNDELWAGGGAVTYPDTMTAQSGFTEDQEVDDYAGLVSASKVVSSTGAAEFTFDFTQAEAQLSLAWVVTWKAIMASPSAARRRIISGD